MHWVQLGSKVHLCSRRRNSNSLMPLTWRGAGAVERGGLENRCPPYGGPRVRIPPSPPRALFRGPFPGVGTTSPCLASPCRRQPRKRRFWPTDYYPTAALSFNKTLSALCPKANETTCRAASQNDYRKRAASRNISRSMSPVQAGRLRRLSGGYSMPSSLYSAQRERDARHARGGLCPPLQAFRLSTQFRRVTGCSPSPAA